MAKKEKQTAVDKSQTLVANAKKKKSAKEGFPCVLFYKGSNKGGILLGVRGQPIPKADVREQRKPFAGGKLFPGVCYGIENGIAIDVFGNPEKDALPEPRKLKIIVNEFLGTTYKTVRGTVLSKTEMGDLTKDFTDLGEDMADEPLQQTSEPETTGASETEANPIEALTVRFKGLQEQLKRVIGNFPDHQAALRKAAAGVIGQLKGGPSGAEKARDALEKLEAILNKLDAALVTETEDTASESATAALDREAIKLASSAWRDASEAVDEQISALQKALRESGDNELEEIAEFGLNGVTGNFKVPLMAALREVDSANDDALSTAAKKARDAAINFKKHLSGSEQVAACDDNPFGVSVSIASTLGGALDEVERALAG